MMILTVVLLVIVVVRHPVAVQVVKFSGITDSNNSCGVHSTTANRSQSKVIETVKNQKKRISVVDNMIYNQTQKDNENSQ
jgi:predicted secreted protein